MTSTAEVMFAHLGDWLGAREGCAFSLLLVHLNLLIYSLTYWMQQPVLPFLASELGAGAMGFGILQSVVSIFALVGSPLLGRTTDAYGAKIAIIISQLGSVAMFTLMALSYSLPLLFLSRVPAVVQHCHLCAQAAIAMLSSTENRALAIGRLSLSYGCGMVFGSPLGGFLSSTVGNHHTAAVAALISATMVGLDVFILPPMKATTQEGKSTTQEGESGGLGLRQIFDVLGIASVRDVLIVVTLMGVGNASWDSMFALITKDQFGFAPHQLGEYMGFRAILGVITNAILIGLIVGRFGDYKSVVGGLVLLALSLLGFSMTTSFYAVLTVTVPFSIASPVNRARVRLSRCLLVGILLRRSLLFTLANAMISKSVSVEMTGTAISLFHVVRSATGVIAPVLGGFVYERLGYEMLALFASATTFISACYALTLGKRSLQTESDCEKQ